MARLPSSSSQKSQDYLAAAPVGKSSGGCRRVILVQRIRVRARIPIACDWRNIGRTRRVYAMSLCGVSQGASILAIPMRWRAVDHRWVFVEKIITHMRSRVRTNTRQHSQRAPYEGRLISALYTARAIRDVYVRRSCRINEWTPYRTRIPWRDERWNTQRHDCHRGTRPAQPPTGGHSAWP